jgi:hypothetical protein
MGYGFGTVSSVTKELAQEKFDRLEQRRQVTEAFTAKVDAIDAKLDRFFEYYGQHAIKKSK